MPVQDNIFNEMKDLFDSDLFSNTQPKQKEVLSTPNTSIQQAQQIDVTALEKLHAIADELNQIMVEREDAITCLMLAVISGQNMLMLGPAGAGKSMLAYEFCNRIEQGVYFQWLLNKTSDPSEIIGPVSIKSMENDHFKRIPTGKLPEAHIAFIDECYKANSPTLNIMLPIMNEKIFYNDGHAIPIPLITMIGASNEPPEDDSLMPFHDRFLFRMNMSYVKDTPNKKRMFSNYLAKRANMNVLSQITKISIQEIKALEKKSRSVQISRDIINSFVKLLKRIKDKHHIILSDRRQNECLKILQASAVYRGSSVVSTTDFKSLEYVLWEKDDDLDIIREEISKFTNPYDSELTNIVNTYNEIKKDMENTPEESKNDKAIEVKTNIDNILSKLNRLEIEASKNGHPVDKFEQLKNEMGAYAQATINEVLKDFDDSLI